MNWPPPLRVAIPVVLLIFGATAGWVSHRHDRRVAARDIEAQFRERAKFVGSRIATMCAYFIEIDKPDGAQREVAISASDADLRFLFVLDGADTVLFSTRYEWRGKFLSDLPFESLDSVIAEARSTLAGGVGVSSDRCFVTGAFPFPIAARAGEPLARPEVGVVFVEFDLTHRKAQAEAASARRTQVVGVLMLGLVGLFSLFFHRTLTGRVARLVQASRELATGNISARASLSGGDELAELSRAFDQMASDLQRGSLALRESEARFRCLVEGIAQVFWLTQIEPRRVLYVSPAFATVWQRSPEEVIRDSRVWLASVHPEDRDAVIESVETAFKGGQRLIDIRYRIIRPDGSVRWIRDHASEIDLGPGQPRCLAGIAEDITEQHNAAAERADLERKLQETQKLESLGVLAGGIAHDFNNLLTGILGNASLARLDIPASSPARGCLSQIEAVAMRAADLCKQMLAYSGRGKFEVQRLNLSALVEETTQLIQLSISKSAVLRLSLAPDLPSIEADATQIRQVIMNLVINASEALEEKSGIISLSTGVVRVDRDYFDTAIFAAELPPGDYVSIEVCDTGCGMSQEKRARIFEPFFTTKFQGRGLGLSAVLGIVRGHRGAMKVYSEAGRGTTFKLLFPAVAGPAEVLEKSEVSDSWKGSGTLLIVDDEETVRAVAARMAQTFGFTPLLAVDGRDAVEKFQHHRGEITAVLMDLTMPHVDGEQAFRELRRIDPAVRVILMSGFNEQEAINRFTGKGLAGFLQKPFKPSMLRAKLRELFSRSSTLGG
jgi:PAS domain S-box-containing protein